MLIITIDPWDKDVFASMSPLMTHQKKVTVPPLTNLMSSRNFVFTWNNYEEDDIETLKSLVPETLRYVAFSREVAPTTGTPHLQGWITHNKKSRVTAVRSLLPGVHIEVMRGSFNQNDKYCSKSSELEHYGDRPNDPKESEKDRWKKVMELSKAQQYERIMDDYPDIWIRYSTSLKKIHQDVLQVPKTIDVLDNYWYTGRSGAGKSRTARDRYPAAYIKMANKWWDGYAGEESVIIEDWSPDHVNLVNDLKLWTDHGQQRVETKHGSINVRPKTVIVTSQYTIEECFSRVRDSDAIIRRFTVVNF